MLDSAGMGVFGYTAYVDAANNNISGMITDIVLSLVSVVASFIAVFLTYHNDPPKTKAAAPAASGTSGSARRERVKEPAPALI